MRLFSILALLSAFLVYPGQADAQCSARAARTPVVRQRTVVVQRTPLRAACSGTQKAVASCTGRGLLGRR